MRATRRFRRLSPRMKLGIGVVVLVLLAAGSLEAQGSALAPRRPAQKDDPYELAADAPIVRVVLKLHEGTAVRLRNGRLVVTERNPRERDELQRLGLAPGQVVADVATAQRLVKAHGIVRGIARLFTAGEESLRARRETGEVRGGRELADLNLYFELEVPPGTRFADTTEILQELNVLPSVEIAYAEPPAEPAMVANPTLAVTATTPNFQGLQGYLDPAPGGIDALYAWTIAGGRGLGVEILDLEWAWRTTHEDLPALFHQGGTQLSLLSYRNHGTAVLGELVARNNGFGVTGIAHQAQAGYESFASQSTSSAIFNASATLGPGDLMLLEIHRLGPLNPDSDCSCNPSQCDYIPVEGTQADFDAIAQATANGVVVVEAAGNGSSNLDHPVYNGVFDRSVRDSGAILVAASLSTGRVPTCWTNWGNRIDAHGWGENVVTLGYGSLYDGGSEDSWYTAGFNGTSSASPIVTGAAASVQGASRAAGRGSLSPSQMRQLLADTGTPATHVKNIGPLPNLRGAVDRLLFDAGPRATDDSLSTRQEVPLPVLYATLTGNDAGTGIQVIHHDLTTAKGGSNDVGTDGFSYTPPFRFHGTDWFDYTIQDADGYTDRGRVFVEVAEDPPPVACFTVSCDGLLGCSFEGGCSTDDLGITAYRWDFGDASPLVESPDPSQTHVYEAKGTYPVTLTVVDGIGQESSLTQNAEAQDYLRAVLAIITGQRRQPPP